ncbi:MAG: hypothetical protein H7Z38_02755 [Rubrivivax sp.]|nr:hypothetical protein [Pyrinomonadaceae bacterium]
MSSEKEANLAREQHSEFLRKLGAHAIAVDEIKRNGEKTFGVIAFCEKKPGEVPKTLEVKSGKKTLEVPLAIRVAEKFKPE